MKVGFIIVGRLKSTRLKKKLLLDLVGQPVILRMIERIRQSKFVDEVILATSTHAQDDELVAAVANTGVLCFRGHEDDVLERIYKASCQFKLDYIVHVTADCPLVDPEYIDKTIDAYKRTNADLITSFDLPHGVFCYGIKPAALETVLKMKNSDNTEVWGKYFYDTDCFDIVSLSVEERHKRQIRLTLDYLEDYQVLSRIYEYFFSIEKQRFTLDDIIAFADRNPEVIACNQHCNDLYKERSAKQSEIELKDRYAIKRVAIIGCGSIGQRHIRNLQALGVKDIVALRTKKGAVKELPADLLVTEVFSWSELLDAKPDVAIISNPSSLHLTTFNKLIGKVRGIFIEKPISHNLEGVLDSIQLISQYKPVTFVGYNLQFHPVIKKLSDFIQQGDLGMPIAFQANVGQWLPDWHPGSDYKELYVANKDLGGGALLSLIHEVQMALDFCGPYNRVTALFPKSKLLALDVDVKADLMIEHTSGAVSQIHIDLIQKPMSRAGVIICQRGNIKYDLINKTITLCKHLPTNPEVLLDQMEYDVNQSYLDMMKQFFSLVRQGRYRHQFDFMNAVQSLELVQNAFDSETMGWRKRACFV